MDRRGTVRVATEHTSFSGSDSDSCVGGRRSGRISSGGRVERGRDSQAVVTLEMSSKFQPEGTYAVGAASAGATVAEAVADADAELEPETAARQDVSLLAAMVICHAPVTGDPWKPLSMHTY